MQLKSTLFSLLSILMAHLSFGQSTETLLATSVPKELNQAQSMTYTEVSVTPETFVEAYNAASTGTRLMLSEGDYNSAVALPVGKVLALKAAAGAHPQLNFDFDDLSEGSGGALILDGLSIDCGGSNSYIKYSSAASMDSIVVRNCTVSNVNRCFVMGDTEGATLKKLEFSNSIFDCTAATGWCYTYFNKGNVQHVAIKNCTFYNYTGGENVVWARNQHHPELVMNVSFTHNTVYNSGKDAGRSFIKIENEINDASVFTFRDNVFYDDRAINPGVLSVKNNIGTAIAKKNLIVGFSNYAWDTNENNTLETLGMSAFPFPAPSNGDFTFYASSPLGTASTTGGAIGDLRWFVNEVVTVYDITFGMASGVSEEAGTLSRSTGQFAKEATIDVEAIPNFGFRFVKWVDAAGNELSTNSTYEFVVTQTASVLAVFEALDVFSLNVISAGAGGFGEVAISPAGKNGQFSQYEKGTLINLTALENEVVKFSNWNDGSTLREKSFVIDNNTEMTANFTNLPYIAAWSFNEPGKYVPSRLSELYSKTENRPELFAYYVSDNALADNMRMLERNGRLSMACQWGTNDLTYFKTSMSTIGFENINIKSAIIAYYRGADEWSLQYSLDDVTYHTIESININSSSFTDCNALLPEAAEGKAKVYIRWYPNAEGTLHGNAADHAATLLSGVYIMGDEVPVEDEVEPILQAMIPAENANTVSATGSIILTFDEKIKQGTGNATLGGKVLDAEFINKTVRYNYYALAYNTEYTFSLPAGALTDLSGNSAAAISITFRTLSKPTATKKTFDFIVNADASDEQIATGKYGRTIESAFDAAPHKATERFLVYITNGTYDLGGDGSGSFQQTMLTLEESKNKVSLIAQSKDGVILKGNPAVGIKNALLRINANDTYIENVIIKHSAGVLESGQRPALSSNGDRNVYKGIRLMSKQDTHVTGGERSFYYKSEIQGDVDFICGGGTHWFEQCDLVLVDDGYIVAPSTDASLDYGYVMNACTISGEGNYYLGRPWKNAPQAVFLNTTMKTLPQTTGWTSMGTIPTLFAEYNSMNAEGGLVNTENRNNVFEVDGSPTTGSYNPVLSAEEADAYTPENVLTGDDMWNPWLVVEQVEAPQNIANSGTTLTWTDNPYAACYVITRNEQMISTISDAEFTEQKSLSEGTYTYTVQAANEFGGLSEVTSIQLNIDSEGNVNLSQNRQEKSNLCVYPTFARNHITVENDKLNDVLTIINTKGIIVKVTNTNSKLSAIDISSLPSGMFFVKNSAGEVAKFIVR